jgi:signal peptidase II
MAVDQATKQLAVASIDRGDQVNVFFGVDFVNVRNTGVAFGALSGGGVLVTLLTLAALTFLLGYFALRADLPGLWIPVGAIAGGALGNLADRARDGAVIDFIDPAFWPAFNVADIAIVLGILGLLYVADTR